MQSQFLGRMTCVWFLISRDIVDGDLLRADAIIRVEHSDVTITAIVFRSCSVRCDGLFFCIKHPFHAYEKAPEDALWVQKISHFAIVKRYRIWYDTLY